MAEKIYNQLVQEVQKFHETPPVLISAYERALKFEDLDILDRKSTRLNSSHRL